MNAITVRGLGKKYKLFSSQGGRFLEYLSLGAARRHTDFWALQDISFEIPAGTTMGILGQNGSGKSTLLSILAGILEPSAGGFTVNGKVSAILELGSGFHPEFSGRDNIAMYGSIMGLSKAEIDERFDDIVRFSELSDFIDQPLRTYSSGMVVRLAFSVAVNVNADILIVDEALAVGDAIFQHRCFRKIRQMQEAGKTILYVGHDTEAVRTLCTSALLLDGGRILERGDPNTVVNKYHALIAERERTYSEGPQAVHGEVPPAGAGTLYDFTANLPDATIVGPEGIPVGIQTIGIHATPRRVIFAHAPSRITYRIPVAPGSLLAFAIGILPGAYDRIPQGVKFALEVLHGSGTDTIFSRVLEPGRNVGERGWHNFLVPLEPYAGETVSLTFSTSGSGEDLSFCWSAWGWAKMIRVLPAAAAPLVQDEGVQGPLALIQEPAEVPGTAIGSGNKKAEITGVELSGPDGVRRLLFQTGETMTIRVHVLFNQDIAEHFTVGIIIKGKYTDIFGTNNELQGVPIRPARKGDRITALFSLPVNLAGGVYSLRVGLNIFHSKEDMENLDRYYDYLYFTVQSRKTFVGMVDIETKVTILDD